MPKRVFSEISCDTHVRSAENKTSVLEVIPLLRRLLVGEAAIVVPGILCTLSRNMRDTVTAVMNGPGFWRDLTIRCMPTMTALPRDIWYFLQNGRLGPPGSQQIQNMAWYLNYKRIVKTLLNSRFYYEINHENAGAIWVMPEYRPFQCNDVDTFFRENVHVSVIRLPSHLTPFRYTINCGSIEPAMYRFALACGQKRSLNYASETSLFSVKRLSCVVVIEIYTEISKMHPNDNFFAAVTNIELPAYHNTSWFDKKSIVHLIDNGGGGGGGPETHVMPLTCCYGEWASSNIKKILLGREHGVYDLYGPKFTTQLAFWWTGNDVTELKHFLIGDLVGTDGTIRIQRRP